MHFKSLPFWRISDAFNNSAEVYGVCEGEAWDVGKGVGYVWRQLQEVNRIVTHIPCLPLYFQEICVPVTIQLYLFVQLLKDYDMFDKFDYLCTIINMFYKEIMSNVSRLFNFDKKISILI